MNPVLYCRLEVINPKGLGKTYVGARIFQFFQGGQVAAHANDMNVRTLRFHELAELHPVNPGHVGVCHDDIVSALPEKPDGLEPIARFIDPMTEKGYLRQYLQNIRIVVHDQKFHGTHPSTL